MKKYEWRVTWKRVDTKQNSCLRQTEAGARRRIEQLMWTDEQPKTEYNEDAGYTVPTIFANIPKIEWTRIERRVVYPWRAVP